jgi:protease IV
MYGSMTETAVQNNRKTFKGQIFRRLRQWEQSLVHWWKALGADLRNESRLRRKASVDYVVLPIGGSLPERSGPPRSFLERRLPLPPEPYSLQLLNERLQAIADADNVRGVIFVFRGFNVGLASLQNFRRSVARLREAGKEAIVYTPYLDLVHYYAASAADRIIAPPGAQFDVLGLYTEVLFLKDSLARIGLKTDIIQITPYKTALDRLGKAEMTPEYRAQLDWLLDDQYDMLTTDMAVGRGLAVEELRNLINQAPFPAESALAANLIDIVAYDDELATLLCEKPSVQSENTPVDSVSPDKSAGKASKTVLKLRTWDKGRRLLLEKPRQRTRQFIGVVSLEGMITMGPSRNPPIELPIPLIGGATSGEQTLVSLLRRAEKLDDMAALIFHVDSGGGSALASDLIGRQIEQIAARIPVVVYMGNVAGSGGYYVAAPARHIMSQEGTITGSIGVISGHLSSQGLYDMLSVNRVSLARGENAGLYRDANALTDQEREIFWRSILKTYEQFKEVVAKGRNMTIDAVDEIGGGRVWTGRQALTHRLVDSHGDFLDAIQKAAELAALSSKDVAEVSVVNIFSKSSTYALPKPPGETLEEIGRMLAGEQIKALMDRPLLLIPFQLKIS